MDFINPQLANEKDFTHNEYRSDLDCYSEEEEDSCSDLFDFLVNDESFTPYVDSSSDEEIFNDEIEDESDYIGVWYTSQSGQSDEPDNIDALTEDEEDECDIQFIGRNENGARRGNQTNIEPDVHQQSLRMPIPEGKK
jgi:hypothetical protein